MSAALELQAELYSTLINAPDITALVPADNIGEGRALNGIPAIRIGSIIEVPAGLTFERRHSRMAVDIAIFAREPGTATVRYLADLIRQAVEEISIADPAYHLVDIRWDGTRVMRDGADPELAHAIVGFTALVETYA
ncbi:DUF3168 domain-containing protein [Acuticoccus yangtzensis]|uniref:DUF3168 domain-containing protein n=1 Tax=Acuticoccus yangtzensis TaxID=1443441 RepID=UPI000949AB5D|nr:DUF3168 domain-containing protein [Acuticoccus yangtzensis]